MPEKSPEKSHEKSPAPSPEAPPGKSSEELPGDTPIPLGEHFGELRRRLLISAAVVAVVTGVTLSQIDKVSKLVLRPLHKAAERLVVRFEPLKLEDLEEPFARPEEPTILFSRPPTFRPTEGFVYAVKLGLLVGLLLSTPIILYQLWGFIAPGLTRRERRIIRPVFLFGAFFFLAGIAMAYYWVIPTALYYLAYFDWWLEL